MRCEVIVEFKQMVIASISKLDERGDILVTATVWFSALLAATRQWTSTAIASLEVTLGEYHISDV